MGSVFVLFDECIKKTIREEFNLMCHSLSPRKKKKIHSKKEIKSDDESEEKDENIENEREKHKATVSFEKNN